MIAVHVFGLVHAAIIDVENAVVVVVGIRAAIFVLEAVTIFGIVRALVEVVLDAVAVAITDGRLENESEKSPEIRGFEAFRVARPRAQHEVRVALDEELDATDRFVRQLHAAVRVGQQIRAVRFSHDIHPLEKPVGEAKAKRRAISVDELSVFQREGGRARSVRAKAHVEADLEFPRRAETFLDDGVRPDPRRRICSRVLWCVGDRDADLQADREADPVLDAGDPEFTVETEVADGLRVDLRRVPPGDRAGRGSCVVDLLVARHQVDREIDAQDEEVCDAVVELTGALERMVHELGALLPDVVHAKERVAVVDHQSEADVALADDVRSVGGEEPFGVHRWAEEVCVEAGAVSVGDGVLCPCHAAHERYGARAGEGHETLTSLP